MGLFTQRPEQNEDWGGLPSEPARPQTEAERLADLAPSAGALGIDGPVESIVIPVAPYVEAAQPPQTDADGGDDPESDG